MKIKLKQEGRELDVLEGDLVLLINKNKDSYNLGVFMELGRTGLGPGIKLMQPYHLKPSESFGGVEMPLISSLGRDHTFNLNNQSLDIYVGQGNIIERLKNTPLDVHISWISLLKKPYLESK